MTSHRLHPRFPGIRLGKKKKCEIVRDSKPELSSRIHVFRRKCKFTTRGDIRTGEVFYGVVASFNMAAANQ